MTGRLFFLLLIFISSTVWYFYNSNPIPLFISFCIIGLCFLAFLLATYGRFVISQMSKSWKFTLPASLLKFGEKANFNLEFDKPHLPLFSIFPSLKHNISARIPAANIREIQKMTSKKTAVAILENLPPGSYRFKTVFINSYDFFGLFRFRKKIPINSPSKEMDNLTVLPDLNETGHHFLQKTQILQDIKHKSLIQHAQTLLDSKLFEPADDARRIIWKRYARSNILMVRISEKQNHYFQRARILIDPILPPGQYRFRIPKLGKYLQNINWQRIKERAAYRLYELWQNKIPVSLTIPGGDLPNQELIPPLESGNKFFLQKMLYFIYSLPLVQKEKLKPYSKEYQNHKMWIISGRNLPGIDDYVPLWEIDPFSRNKKLLNGISLFSQLKRAAMLRKIFLHESRPSRPQIRSLLVRFFLLFLKYKDLSFGSSLKLPRQ